MRFGKTLRESVYPPWKDKYIDYTKLKSLLREDQSPDDDAQQPWTAADEERFCDEIFNNQLDKVAQFQELRFNALKQRVDSAFEKLKELAPVEPTERDDKQHDDKKKDDSQETDANAASSSSYAAVAAAAPPHKGEISASRLRTLETELDDITNEVRELKKYSNINYTGFLKIVKKHDRKRGDRYKVRPMMQLSLAQRPFNSETGYSPLLNKLSIMYYAIRQQLEEGSELPVDLETQGRRTMASVMLLTSVCTRSIVCDTWFTNTPQSGSIPITSSRSRHSSFDTCPPWSTASNPQRSWTAGTRPSSRRSTLTTDSSSSTAKRCTASPRPRRCACGGTAS